MQGKVCSNIAWHPVPGTVHPLADLFIPTLSPLLLEAFSHAAITEQMFSDGSSWIILKLTVSVVTSMCFTTFFSLRPQ